MASAVSIAGKETAGPKNDRVATGKQQGGTKKSTPTKVSSEGVQQRYVHIHALKLQPGSTTSNHRMCIKAWLYCISS